jgi:hypothetical protein
MANLLIRLGGKDGLSEGSLGKSFSYAAVVSVVSAEWCISQADSQAVVADWLAGRGEVDEDARPSELKIYRDSWEALRGRAR